MFPKLNGRYGLGSWHSCFLSQESRKRDSTLCAHSQCTIDGKPNWWWEINAIAIKTSERKLFPHSPPPQIAFYQDWVISSVITADFQWNHYLDGWHCFPGLLDIQIENQCGKCHFLLTLTLLPSPTQNHPSNMQVESNYDGKELEPLQSFSPSSPIISDHHPPLGSHCRIHLMRAFLQHLTSVCIYIFISHPALHTCYNAITMGAQGPLPLWDLWVERIAGHPCTEHT